MALQHIAPILVLIFYLYGLSSAGDLHKLAHNKLDEGKDRELPHSTPIKCGYGTPRKVTTNKYKKPSEALKSFDKIAFTSGAMGAHNGPSPGEKKYKFAEFHGAKVLYALEVDPSGELASWLPQGGTIDIPQHPKANQPHYVFTPDFSGCSWTVTPMHNGMFRLRHVEGNKEAEQFNKLSEAQKGGPVTYAMQYKEYGYVKEPKEMTSNAQGWVWMHYDKHWHMYVQRKTCCPDPGGPYVFNDHHILTGMILNEYKQTKYPPISGTKHFTIPT